MDHAAASTTASDTALVPQRCFVPRRVLTTFATPLAWPRVTPQREEEVAGLLARTVAFRREPFRVAAAPGPLALPSGAGFFAIVPAVQEPCLA